MRNGAFRPTVECVRFASTFDCRRVSINTNKNAALSEGGKYLDKMSRATKCRINHSISRLQVERLEHLLHKHRLVTCLHISAYRLASRQMRRHHAQFQRYTSSTLLRPRSQRGLQRPR